MKTLLKFAAAATLTGAIALAAVTPSEARGGRNAAAIGIGIGAGVLAGAAIAGANNGYYYNNGYYGEPGYAYGAYGPGYDGYAYEAAPVYVEPQPTYYYSRRNRSNLHGCDQSPASPNFNVAC